MRPSIACVEGIVGAGKSAIIHQLEVDYTGSAEVVVLQEPTKEWEGIRHGGNNLLELYYE